MPRAGRMSAAAAGLVLCLSAAAGLIWKNLGPPGRPAAIPLTTRALPGELALVMPEGTVLESAGYPLAGRLSTSDPERAVQAQASWSEAPDRMGANDLAEVHRAWREALIAGHVAPQLADRDPGTCAGHPAVRSRGVSGDGLEYRGITWACPVSRRVVHVLLEAPVGVDLSAVEEALEARSRCHGAAAAAPPGPRARLPVEPGWTERGSTGTRRVYASPNGLVEVVLEEGPPPSGSPVEHVMQHSELWPQLLTGVLGKPLPVEVPGAQRVTVQGHDAVRVHGRLQSKAVGGAPAPILFAETSIWVCPKSERLVSLSAVSPDAGALARARPLLERVACH